MALIGDVIMAAREQFPDIPQTIPAPAIFSATAGSGGTLGAGNYYVVATAVNQWGETLPSAQSGPVTVGANGILTVVCTISQGTTAIRVYAGTTTGVYTFYQVASSSTVVLGATGNVSYPGTPPSFNSAFNPDSDGSSIGAYTMYRWLNDALTELSRIAGGILDMTGVQAQLNQADYVIPSTPTPWIRFTDVWFDGYYAQDFKRRNQWRRQFISALTFYWSVEQVNRQIVLNFYPSPNRAGTTTTLASGIASTDSTIPLASIPTGLMSPGMVHIDTETIIFSSTSGTNLTGCIRGMGGTLAFAHNSGATVTEYNLVLAGFRQPPNYSPGVATNDLLIPVGWEVPVNNFLLARYRNYEQNPAEAKQYYAQFIEEARRIAFDSRQFPASGTIGGPASFLTLYPGGPFGVIVP